MAILFQASRRQDRWPSMLMLMWALTMKTIASLSPSSSSLSASYYSSLASSSWGSAWPNDRERSSLRKMKTMEKSLLWPIRKAWIDSHLSPLWGTSSSPIKLITWSWPRSQRKRPRCKSMVPCRMSQFEALTWAHSAMRKQKRPRDVTRLALTKHHLFQTR